MKKKFRKLKMVDPVTLLEVIPMEDFFLPLERPLEFSKNGRSSGRFRGSFPWKSRSYKTLPDKPWLYMIGRKTNPKFKN